MLPAELRPIRYASLAPPATSSGPSGALVPRRELSPLGRPVPRSGSASNTRRAGAGTRPRVEREAAVLRGGDHSTANFSRVRIRTARDPVEPLDGNAKEAPAPRLPSFEWFCGVHPGGRWAVR